MVCCPPPCPPPCPVVNCCNFPSLPSLSLISNIGPSAPPALPVQSNILIGGGNLTTSPQNINLAQLTQRSSGNVGAGAPSVSGNTILMPCGGLYRFDVTYNVNPAQGVTAGLLQGTVRTDIVISNPSNTLSSLDSVSLDVTQPFGPTKQITVIREERVSDNANVYFSVSINQGSSAHLIAVNPAQIIITRISN